MRSAAIAVLLLAACASAAAAGQDITDWRDASRCVGRVCSVRGEVAATEVRGNVVRLYFDARHRDVSVALIRGWLSDFPEHPDEYYRGNEIVVTGPVRRFHDQIEIVARAREDVRRIGVRPAATAGTAPSQIEALEARVRDLERRVERLEKRNAAPPLRRK